MQIFCAERPALLSSSIPGDLVRISWGEKKNEHLAIVLKQDNPYTEMVFLPLVGGLPFFSRVQPGKRAVVNFGANWVLEPTVEQSYSAVKTSRSLNIGTVCISDCAAFLFCLDHRDHNIGDSVCINLDQATLDEPGGPVIETDRWKIWAQLGDRTEPGKTPIFEYRGIRELAQD